MTRRPASRRPPKLHDPERERARESAPKGPSPRDQLKSAHVSGRSVRFGRDEIVAVMRRIVDGDARVRFGLPPFFDLTIAHVEAAVESTYGWKGDGPRARIAPARTVDGFVAARDRVLEVARAGGSIAFATSRPASLLSLYRELVAYAAAEGATVLEQPESSLVGPGGRRLWWLDGVAVLTDHESLLGDAGTDAADELLFTLPRPDLVVGDRVFAGAAVAAGHEVVAFADLDAAALAVAAWRGLAVRVVPLDERRPPSSYGPLLDLVAAAPEPEPGFGCEAVASHDRA
jgi:hypothetical protein